MQTIFRPLLLLMMLLPVCCFAAGGPEGASSINFVLIGLVTLVVVMVFVIGVLANVLKGLVTMYRDRLRQERASGSTAKTIALLAGLLLTAGSAFAAEATTDAAEAAPVVSQFISGIPKTDFYFIMSVLALEVLVIFVMLAYIRRFILIIRNVPEKESWLSTLMQKNWMDKFNQSVDIAEEHTIDLHHDYDGIRELDNSLPPWWKWGFAFTIVFAVVYLWYYHIGGGPNQAQEYAAAVEIAEQEKAAYLAKSGEKIDETNVKLVDNESEISLAKTVFANTCAACHGADGGGSVGPNLTDSYWLHGGSLQDVFKSIKYGWKDKGMPEWQHSIAPKQIAALASYIKSMKGTKPTSPKAPQGELYVESSSTTDSTGSPVDAASPATAKPDAKAHASAASLPTKQKEG